MIFGGRHTRVGDLEEDVLHDVAAVGALELKLVALEEDVVEAPDGSGEDGGYTAARRFMTLRARLTARWQASPAAQDLRDMVLGEWR